MTLIALVAAYLIGAIPVGYVVARLTGGIDVRQSGSGTIGATNVLRTVGKGAAIVTLLGDVAKGFAAVGIARAIDPAPASVAAAAVLAIIGNCWPVFLRFRGGKGVATGFGAFLALTPWATLPAAIVFAVVLATFRYVSLGSIMACLCLPIGVAILAVYGLYPVAFIGAAIGAAVIIVYRHRANVARLLNGAEPRIGQRVGVNASGA